MEKKNALMMVGGFTVLGFLWGAFMAGCVLCQSGKCCRKRLEEKLEEKA